MKIGVDYYPEQWDSSLWSKDAEQMLKTGVNIIRICDGAWSSIEYQDSLFYFDWLDEAINTFENAGIEIMMCIPTDCPPLWLYKKYPQIIQVGADGKPVQIGVRGHRCINSPIFLAYAKRLTEQLVRRYGHKQSVVAWQIDSELESYQCTCEICRDKFRKWLLDKYDSFDDIRFAIGAEAHSLEYSDISEVEPPTAYPLEWQNPALCLEYKRFSAECTAEYVNEIASIIRREVPRANVTTNTWFCENAPDYYKLFENLDFVSYDNYPPVVVDRRNQVKSHAFRLDMMRGIKKSNFWITEQLSGAVGGWTTMSPTPRPGMIMGYSLQAFAHGADAVMHFRWRTAVKGSEMFLHGILDQSNILSRRFFEFSELCKTVSKIDVFTSANIVSEIAILYSPDCFNALKIQPQTEDFDYLEQLENFHSAFARYGANIDVVSANSDLSGYKIVVAPAMFVNEKSVIENIYRFVINGGTLVMTCRSGVKDNNNNCIMEALPTIYKQLVGAEVTEYDPIGDSIDQTIKDFAGKKFRCKQWCDILHLTTAKVYAEYGESFYKCCPAVTMNKYCNGMAYYVGTVCEPEFYESFAGNLMVQAKIPRLKGLPKGVEVVTRTNGINEYIFFFNNSNETVMINLPKSMYSIIDSRGKDVIRLIPFDVDIVRK